MFPLFVRNIIILSAALLLQGVALVHVGPAWTGKDLLASPWLQGPYVSIDAWSLVHVYTLALCGFAFPGKLTLFMILSTLFEVFEAVMALGNSGWNSIWQERGVNTLWDIWFNLMGYRLGEMLLFYWYLPSFMSNLSTETYNSLIQQASKKQVGEDVEVDVTRLYKVISTKPQLFHSIPSAWWIGLINFIIIGSLSAMVVKNDASSLICCLMSGGLLFTGWRWDIATRKELRASKRDD